LSTTVTVNEQAVDVLPLASVAVQLTVLVPFWKVEPDGGVQLAVAPEQLSFAVAEKVTTAEHNPGAVVVFMFPGQLTVGGCVSFTVTVKLQDVL
jgi:hypothetical protein